MTEEVGGVGWRMLNILFSSYLCGETLIFIKMSNIKTNLELNLLGQKRFKSASTPIIWYSEYFIGKKDRHLYKGSTLVLLFLLLPISKFLKTPYIHPLSNYILIYKIWVTWGSLKYNAQFMSVLLILRCQM